jgi:hypothetical protein
MSNCIRFWETNCNPITMFKEPKFYESRSGNLRKAYVPKAKRQPPTSKNEKNARREI